MKAVIQRVLSASVSVDGQPISSIGKGLLVLVGIDRNDGPSDATTIIKKILTAKLFDDDQWQLWRRSVKDINGEILCVSQFTLLANFKGAKPDFHESMSTIPGKAVYISFMEEIRKAYEPSKVQEGQFGAMMTVSLTNDGPTTILLNSREMSRSSSSSGASTPLSTTALDEQKKKQDEIKAVKAAKREAIQLQTAANAAKRLEAKREVEEKARSTKEQPAGITMENGVGREVESLMAGDISLEECARNAA